MLINTLPTSAEIKHKGWLVKVGRIHGFISYCRTSSSPTPSHYHHYIWLLVWCCSYEMDVMKNANLSVHRKYSVLWQTCLFWHNWTATSTVLYHDAAPRLWQQIHILKRALIKRICLLKNVFMLGSKYACAACLRVFCCFFTFTSHIWNWKNISSMKVTVNKQWWCVWLLHVLPGGESDAPSGWRASDGWAVWLNDK